MLIGILWAPLIGKSELSPACPMQLAGLERWEVISQTSPHPFIHLTVVDVDGDVEGDDDDSDDDGGGGFLQQKNHHGILEGSCK